jgi:glycosyltransferase involved in cell wall biosynthesis
MIHRDPRVSRQVESLIDAGWTVDTIGIGKPAAPGVRHHSWLRPLNRFVATTLGTLVIHGLLPHRLRFRLLVSDQVESAAKERISSGEYGVIVFNDIDFVPWVDDSATFTAAARRAHIHLDLHEYFPITMRRDSLYRRFTASYNAWIRRHIGSTRFTTRSTPVRGISELYAKEFGFSTPAVIRNCPPAVEQDPGAVDPREIELLYHGAYNPTRGIYEIVDAMHLVDERFSMTFMLVGPESYIGELRAYAEGLGDRVRFVPAVPMDEICTAVHRYDLEVMFYPPKTTNLELALPNKFFEAIQGRLGVVIGDSPMMRELVDEHGLGLVVEGWTAQDLAAGINSLTPDRVAGFKRAAHAIASDFSAESERHAFLAIVQGGPEPGSSRD